MAADAQPQDPLIDHVIAGRYRILSRLGTGGMGTAYRSWDERKGIPVVIKLPKRILLEDPQFTARFRREIRLLQGLSHPHIVPITDVGEHDGLPFVVMRFLPGGSLADRRLRTENGRALPNPPGMLHLWLPAIAEALDHVHARGVVHRDVKPANIFFDAFWGAYLGDFGIAKIVEQSDTFDKEHTLTATHMGIGTQEYMSPEQFMPRATIDGRADQYALAVTAYEILAGTRPFTGATSNLVVEVLTHPVPVVTDVVRDLPVAVAAAIQRGLAKDPAERFPTCREFAAAVLRHVPPIADEPDVARLLCPGCASILKLPATAAGRKGRCPRCRTRMTVADDLGALWLTDEEAHRQREELRKLREEAAWLAEHEDELRTAYHPDFVPTCEPSGESDPDQLFEEIVQPGSRPVRPEKTPRGTTKKPSRLYAAYKVAEAIWVWMWLLAIAVAVINGLIVRPLIRVFAPPPKAKAPEVLDLHSPAATPPA